MQNNLSSIFNAITPDNIKNLPIIEDSSQIFIELLNELSPISSDIKVCLSENTTDSISEELPQIYLWDYYSLIANLKTDKNIVNKFKVWNSLLNPSLYPTGMPYIGNSLYINYFTIGEPGGVLSDTSEDVEDFNASAFADKLSLLEGNLLQNKAENYRVNRIFKESKGLKKGIKFIYDILNEYLVDSSERLDITISETGNPFELNISGSLDKDVYRESVAYLSHPLGFICEYTYINETSFVDNYSLTETYKINTLEVRCLSGNVEVYSDEVVDILEGSGILKITFITGNYLLQENDVVKYFDSNSNLLKIYPDSNHCSIYVDYEKIYTSKLSEELTFRDSSNASDTYRSDLVSEQTDFIEEKTFKNGMLINDESIVLSDVLTNDSEQYEVVNIQEEFTIELL